MWLSHDITWHSLSVCLWVHWPIQSPEECAILSTVYGSHDSHMISRRDHMTYLLFVPLTCNHFKLHFKFSIFMNQWIYKWYVTNSNMFPIATSSAPHLTSLWSVLPLESQVLQCPLLTPSPLPVSVAIVTVWHHNDVIIRTDCLTCKSSAIILSRLFINSSSSCVWMYLEVCFITGSGSCHMISQSHDYHMTNHMIVGTYIRNSSILIIRLFIFILYVIT